MNEDKLAIEFFSHRDNLQLGLTIAEQMDGIRVQINNLLWQELSARIDALIKRNGLPWKAGITEHKGAHNCLVGVYCTPVDQQALYLHPMMEQQFLGDEWRIYAGLMWSATPRPGVLKLPEIQNLGSAMLNSGYKSSDNFFAWRWTTSYPRRKEFLLRYSRQPETALEELEKIFNELLIEHGEAIRTANATLQNSAQSLTATLNQLRNELID